MDTSIIPSVTPYIDNNANNENNVNGVTNVKTQHAFALIHFGNNPKYFELELYFCIMLQKYTTQNILYLYSSADTPYSFVEQIQPFVYKTIPFDDTKITYNVDFESKYASFNTLRTCDFIFAYKLVEYEKICIVESDLVIMKNIDDIFNLRVPSILCYNVGNKQIAKNKKYRITKEEVMLTCVEKSTINGGVMLISPNMNTFKKYVSALPIISKQGCAYPNEALFEYINGEKSYYNLPVMYNLSHYHTLRLSQYGLDANGEDIYVFHFNETAHKHLDILKDNWLEQMKHNPNVMAKYRVRKIPILHFESIVYQPYKDTVEYIMKNIMDSIGTTLREGIVDNADRKKSIATNGSVEK
jgi:hypothetical protein